MEKPRHPTAVSVLLFLLAAFYLPQTVLSMDKMSTQEMKALTGQAGVSIAIDDVVLAMWFNDIKFTDTDGIGGGDEAGSLVLGNIDIVTDIQAITGDQSPEGDGSELESPGTGLERTDSSAGVARMADGFEASALSIDVGTCSILTEIANGTGDTAGVVIGLPTMEINADVGTITVSIEQNGAVNDGRAFLDISLGRITKHVLGGTIEIAPH